MSSTFPMNSVSSPQPSSDIRATKRKLDDAFQSLDAAVAPRDPSTEPSPNKKPFNPRSTIYSTLTKYGIMNRNSDPSKTSQHGSFSKNTPNLSAIISRAASKKRKAFHFQPGEGSSSTQPLSPLADYRPSSIQSFLTRLETFKLATYANKPPDLDAVAAAKCGWINEGKDRLVCGICNASWVVAGKDGMSRDAANALVEKQRASLVNNHKTGCPWRTRQCEDSIYRIPLQSPASTVQNIKMNALSLDTVLQDVVIKHPLTATQLSSLLTIVASFSMANETPSEDPSLPSPSEPSQTAVITSLFGWSLAPERPRSNSLSRSSSRLPSTQRTPMLSRSPSVGPGVSPERPTPLIRTAVSQVMARDTSLLHCTLCQRRVGLWAFAPPKQPSTEAAPSETTGSTSTQPLRRTNTVTRRQFDLLKEHRSYCPYVVRSTTVPSLPISPSVASVTTSRHSLHIRSSSSSSTLNNMSGVRSGVVTTEGWRAVLTVVLRYRMSQRQQLLRIEALAGGGSSADRRNSEDHDMEVDDGVEVMVQGVKSRGGSDLLKYVKGLLG